VDSSPKKLRIVFDLRRTIIFRERTEESQAAEEQRAALGH